MGSAGFYLFFQMQDIFGQVAAFGVRFRITGGSNIKAAGFANFPNQFLRVAIIGLYGKIGIDVSAQSEDIFNPVLLKIS